MSHGTDVIKMEDRAMSEQFEGRELRELLKYHGVTREVIDLKEKPIFNDVKKDIDIASCDRVPLLRCFLNGSFTEDDTGIGSGLALNYSFLPEATMDFSLRTDTDWFMIMHQSAFVSEDGQTAIPIQKHGSITRKDLEEFIEQ